MRTQGHTVRPMQSGFTLIELIIVIVIVGIMAAVAIPKYNDMAAAARTSALQGVGGSVASAAATNYAMKSGGMTGGITLTTCTAAFGLVTGVPAEITMGAGTLTTAGVPSDCTLTHSGGGTQVVKVLGVS